ncbi:MAG: penicillin-binding transpeptidase domain-containing protein [Syntrophales bacterium]|nr:penicillin-binding transpeptidase domain-containing protein [Syntrophales bacterium]
MKGRSKKWLRFRTTTLLVFFLVLFIALISRAYQLQVLSGKTLKAQADKQHTSTLQFQPERGLILDRNGEKLAASIMVDSVCANPSKIDNPEEVSSKLSSVLGIKRRTLLKKLSKSRNFCWVARKISPSQAGNVNALDIDGIFLIKEPKRFYPNRELAGQLLGFAGLDSTGLEGLELKYDSHLKGIPEKIFLGKDAKGKKIYSGENPTAGKKSKNCNLILTIDSRIQYLVESQLDDAVKKTGAKGGVAIVMNPKTGEILAMANMPGFNPNTFFRYSPESWRNKVITDCFDPGSTFKPFLLAASLEEGVIDENNRFYCENGSYAVGDRIIRDLKKYEDLSFREIIKYSSNIGAVKISEILGKKKFYQYIQEFGFGSKTGIDLPGESPGILRKPEDWTKVDMATISFGQGVSVTAIQLISAFSAIANHGVLMKPYVVRGLIDQNNRVVKEFTPTVIRKVISPATAEKLTSVLIDVVEGEDGTGRGAQIANVAIAGKSGTSQKFDFAEGVYSRDKVSASFMGFFPAEDPCAVILVVLDEPATHRWGGVAAAPVFKNIAESMLYWVGPSSLTTCATETGRHDLGPTNLPTSTSDVNTSDMADYGVKYVNLTSSDESTMPDFRGMSIRNALKLSQERGIGLKIVGSGWAVKQNPLPGVPAESNESCTVSFSTGY